MGCAGSSTSYGCGRQADRILAQAEERVGPHAGSCWCGEHACLHLHTESRRTEDRDIKPAAVNDKRRQSYIVLLFRPQDCIYPSYVDARPRGGMFENSCTAVAGVVWNKLSSTPELRRARIFFVDPATTCACTVPTGRSHVLLLYHRSTHAGSVQLATSKEEAKVVEAQLLLTATAGGTHSGEKINQQQQQQSIRA